MTDPNPFTASTLAVVPDMSPDELVVGPSTLPVFVPSSVTDPVSNLDFLPVDDAFALEFRSETIEQLAGGDALRRGESERIEAGRSQTNADLVAGRDRVRVQDTLHEHTGHGLAEQAAHLHTTVDGALDVHAASEDTVLLAGHMRELWDGGAAIVAAMTDDTVAGGGIRVTTPLDLWVHGLMGVEERIGTCTADAVLMELGATHYEREYGSGAHAAGLAVYAGSLYQSSRSTFRPLMRVSSGVRNLIAGGGGGGGDRGAGDAPGASPQPVQTDAAEASATGTLAAGRADAKAPATALDTADALTDARRESLDALVNSVDARVGEDVGEAGAVMRAEDLPRLTRSAADTAEQLGSLRETLRMDATELANEASGGFRALEFDGAVSKLSATGRGGPLEITPPSAICGENAPMVPPHPGVAWGQKPKMRFGLLGGADRPPQSTTQAHDFFSADRRLRDLRNHFRRRREMDIANDFDRTSSGVSHGVVQIFESMGGIPADLLVRPSCVTKADMAYLVLHETARQADRDRDLERAGTIREALVAIDKQAVDELEALSRNYGIADDPAARVILLQPVTAGPKLTVAAIPPPTRAPAQFDWVSAYRQLRDLVRGYKHVSRDTAIADFYRCADRISYQVIARFRDLGGDSKRLPRSSNGVTKAELAYRAIENMSRQATKPGETTRAYQIRGTLKAINRITSEALRELTDRYGELDALSTQDLRAMERLPPEVGPTTSAALPVTVRAPGTVPSTTAPPLGRLDIPDPAPPIALEVTSAFSEPAGGLVHGTGVPGPPTASGLPAPSLAEAAGAEVGDLGRGWLDPPATASGATATDPAATEAIVTPSFGEMSSFWLQPADPPATASDATATEPAATEAIVTPSLGETSSFWLQPADPGPGPGPGSVSFDFGLHHASETVQPPPVATTPGSTASGPGAPFLASPRLDDDVAIERLRNEPAAPSTVSATGRAEFWLTEIDPFLGTAEGASHPAPLAPPSAPGRTGAGAVAPPTAADPRRIRPSGTSGGPHPVAFDPRSAPPGSSSQVVYTDAIPTPVLSTGAPPGWQGAGTPGFVRAAAGAAELPFPRREVIARLEADLTRRTGGAEALGWSATRWQAVLDDFYRINAIAQSATPAMAHIDRSPMIADIDWSAVETLMRVFDAQPPSP